MKGIFTLASGGLNCPCEIFQRLCLWKRTWTKSLLSFLALRIREFSLLCYAGAGRRKEILMRKMRTIELTTCALFAALTAVLSQVVIPIQPVPINLATFSVFLAGALLGGKLGAVSQGVYVLLGAVGVPVFTMFRGGVGVLVGPTGGYIIGYVLAAGLIGFIAERYGNKIYVLLLAMFAGFLAYMATGTCWYMFCMKTRLVEALMACVVPFLFFDVLKMIAAAVLTRCLKPILQKQTRTN